MRCYGLIKDSHAYDYATIVCNTMGHGANHCAVEMLLETAAVETHLGQYRDPTEYGAGTGLTQIDESTFDWLVKKFTGSVVAKRLKQEFNITLEKVSYVELANSPLLAFIFCRLRYMTVSVQIPKTREARAHYWKDHYNSHHPNAAGTPEKYLARCEMVLDTRC